MSGDFGSLQVWLTAGLLLLAAGLAVLWLRSQAQRRDVERRLADRERDAVAYDQQLQQARRMEAVGILAGGIVNNLNNLLAVILGNARLLAREIESGEGNSGREELDRVVKAGHMAGDLVRELSDFYRQADQARKPTDLVPVVRDSLKLLRDILPSTVEIVSELQPCGPVLATAAGIQQILMNLCSNGVQAMQKTCGTLTVTLGEEQVHEPRHASPADLQPGSYVRLTVADNGRGMDDATLDRVFETSAQESGGRALPGLGLRTVQRVLADHQGVSVASSKAGEGTQVDLFFPLIAWSVQAGAVQPRPALTTVPTSPGLIQVPAADEESTAARRATVLLVDDEEMVAQVLSRGLRRLGYRVVVHEESRRALADFTQTPELFDIVVTDQIMPYMSGVRLTRKIHDIRPGIPVLICTGFRDSFNEQQAREAGVSDFILKPTSHRDLAALIERHLLKSLEGRA